MSLDQVTEATALPRFRETLENFWMAHVKANSILGGQAIYCS